MRFAGEKEGIFDANPAELIAQYTLVPGGVRTLAGYKNMADTFDREFVERQLAKPMRNGKLLSVSHFVELATIASASDRNKMFETIRRDGISVGDLRDHLAAHGLRSCIKKGGGRKPKSPVSPVTGLRRLANHTERLRKFAVVCEGVIDRLDEMPPDTVSNELLNQVESAETSTTQVMKCLETLSERLLKAKRRIVRVMTQKSHDAQPQPVA